MRVWIIREDGICAGEYEVGSSEVGLGLEAFLNFIEKGYTAQVHKPVPHIDRSLDLPYEELEKRRQFALEMLRFPEGSFSHAFLDAFIRADVENMRLLTEAFDVLREKFQWDKKHSSALLQ